MNHWDVASLEVEPHAPRILSSTDDGRAIVIELPAGERLQEHEVHERAWVLVVTGEVEVETETGERASGGAGLLMEFAPHERHEVVARSATRLLLLLTPWPGDGHPGAMSLEDKQAARARAAERRD
jgi:redox-sensitive bicupin YhaK (pirin superfamily)